MSAEREKFVDRFVEDGLAGYSNVEPRPGLERRVLANLRAQPRKRLWWFWLPLPVAASLLVGVVLWLTRSEPKPPIATESTPQTPVVSVPGVNSQQTTQLTTKHPPRRVARTESAVAVVAKTGRQPRQPVFPSPAPMSEQERLLLAFVKQHPDEAQAVVREQEEWRKSVEEMFSRNNQ